MMSSETAELAAPMTIDGEPEPTVPNETDPGDLEMNTDEGEEPPKPDATPEERSASNEDGNTSATGSDDDDGSSSDDNMDDDDDDVDDDKKGKKAGEDPEFLLIKATTCKEEGNKYFTEEKDYEKASRLYRKGVNAIKGLNNNKANNNNTDGDDDQVKVLLLSLQTNLSMMQFKLKKYSQSQAVATKALQVDPHHVKALYRRAAARRKLGDPDGAMADLKDALAQEPNNTTVRKEFLALKNELEAIKKAQKLSLQKAFSKGGLYDDKEAEKRKEVELAKQKQKETEEVLKKRKQEWEDECVKRMTKGEEVISFDDWDKERVEWLEKERKEVERKRKEHEKRLKEERRKAREAANNDNDDDDESESFTEKELAEMRGYKKTKDGRITSYFTRESAHQIDVAPKPISASPQPITPTSSVGDCNTGITSSGKGKSSVWNRAGTWEEKDTTEWCRDQLTKRLQETKAEASGGSIVGVVAEVKDMTGDASVAIVSGKKRYIFDFHCKVKFEIRESDTDDILASGSLRLPDICSTHHEELEVEFSGWKKKPASENQSAANDCRQRLASEVRESVMLWVTDFNSHY